MTTTISTTIIIILILILTFLILILTRLVSNILKKVKHLEEDYEAFLDRKGENFYSHLENK